MKSLKKLSALFVLFFFSWGVFAQAAGTADWSDTARLAHDRPGCVKVYFTKDISPAGLEKVYQALGRKADGKNVAVKVSTGEPGGNYYLHASLIGGFVKSIRGTIVECNTAYGGGRATTALHRQVAKDHGFTSFAKVDIMDENGSVSYPVVNGKHLKEVLLGKSWTNYDFYVILSHFKGHAMGGFGGAVKNVAIGMSSASGKMNVHSAGASKTKFLWQTPQNDFLESMAEDAKVVADKLGPHILYINVMNNLSVDCDCDSNPARPDMNDIGIVASTDPVAIDQACVDFVYAAPDGRSLIERMESRNGIHTLEYGESIGLGSRNYTLVRLDK
jgi:uncharacterized Fe-S center protein